MKHIKNHSLIRWTCLWIIKQPRLPEFIRGSYFVLICSAVLNFAFKFASLSCPSLTLYCFGILFFLFGGRYSYLLVTRFRKHEVDYRKQPKENQQSQTSLDFYCNLEKGKGFQHLAFYSSWFIALIFIGWSVLYESSRDTGIKREYEIRLQHIDSLLQKIYQYNSTVKVSQDSLSNTVNDLRKRAIKVDSTLMKISKIITPMKEIKK